MCRYVALQLKINQFCSFFLENREVLCVVTSTRAAAEAEWRRLEHDNVLSWFSVDFLSSEMFPLTKSQGGVGAGSEELENGKKTHRWFFVIARSDDFFC